MRTGTFALEINMPCAGPIYAMVLALQMIRSGKYKRGLLVGCDRMSSFVDHSDFRMATLFGDGAGACIVEASQGLGIEDFHLASKGEDMSNPALIIPGGKAAAPTISEAAPNKLLMNGKSVEAFIGSSFDDTILNLSKDNIDDLNKSIDHIVPHQASLRSIESNIARSGLPVSKLIMTLYEYGNTSSASIYITLDKLFSTNDMSDKRILILGVGGGLNWGGLIYKHP
jgi:3-oxoacyl-[acyl-carrier-protein] synthase-3